METLESSRVCRLCGKQSGISINIFDKNENHVKKINAVLPIMVHEMDLLPKHMCHRCSYKLEEFHKFYVDCLKTDADLKSQLSWMRKADTGERVGVPMVHIENIKIKVEPPDYDAYDMNSMVDNVDYINSMSSVTFPVDGVRSKDISKGITYAAYARCGCYCDKPDQSNEKTVPEHFDNGIPKCSRISDVRSGNNSCVNKSQTIRTNILAGKTLEEPASLVTFVGGTTFNVGSAKGRFSNANEKTPGTAIVRNLRPRKSYVNYVGSKRKAHAVALPFSGGSSKNAHRTSAPFTKIDTAQIKVEKLEEIAGRILRPRKGAVDYIGPKRKYSRNIGQNLRSHGKEHRSCKTKVRNISNKLKSSPRGATTLLDGRINVTIKKEHVSDFEDFVLDESVSAEKLPKQQLVSGIGDLIDQIGILPNDRVAVADLRNDPINCSTFSRAQYTDRNCSIASRCKHSKSSRKGELKSGKDAERNCSAKYLRSQNIHRTMKSGKIRKLESVDVSARRLRRSLRNLTENGKTTGRDLSKVIRGTVNKLSPLMKLPDNIKHYCEECNTSFANKELFKLHACYGH